MSRKLVTKEEFQERIDNLCGEGEWAIKEFEGTHKPLVIVHRCGEEKRLTRASSFTTGGRNNCVKCNNLNGRPRLTFAELDNRIREVTYDTYELIELTDSKSFIVNHKSCERPPFETSISRFFSKNARCQCVKSGKVGRKSKKESIGFEVDLK